MFYIVQNFQKIIQTWLSNWMTVFSAIIYRAITFWGNRRLHGISSILSSSGTHKMDPIWTIVSSLTHFVASFLNTIIVLGAPFHSLHPANIVKIFFALSCAQKLPDHSIFANVLICRCIHTTNS